MPQGKYKMKKTFWAIISAMTLLLMSCATAGNGGGSAGAGNRAAPMDNSPVYEGEGLSLAEAVEQSAEKIASDLPAGSRVVIVAWESPSAGLSDYIMEELTGALVDRDMEVVDRQNLEYVYRELKLQMSGEVSDESARSVGKFLGADLVITGQLTELGGPYRYRANAINVESATRDSVTRLDVKGDAQMRRLVAALANQKTAVKSASYEEGRTTAPRTAGTFLDRGITLAGQGEYESAIADFTEAIRLDPNYTAAYYNRGNAYNNKGDNDRAIADYTQAIRLDPNYAAAYNNRGIAYNDKGDNDRAIADFNQAIRLDPNYAIAYSNRGNAYYSKGDYDRAIADFNQAIRLDPNFAAAYSNRGNAYNNKGDNDRAIADFNQAIRLDPNLAIAYYNRGIAYNNKGDNDRAIADYNQAIRLDPNDAYAYNGRGNAYYSKGDYDQAIADSTASLRIEPNNVSALYWRGNAYYNREPPTVIGSDALAGTRFMMVVIADDANMDHAIADYTALLRIEPNNAGALYGRGNAYFGKRDWGRAIADYTASLRIEPNNADARDRLDKAQKAQGHS
jgi:tetratricopeptide (TPR) repeat protein